MEQIKRTLKQRMERLTRPEPTITIYNGHQFYLTDPGEMGQRSQASVQLSGRFRCNAYHLFRVAPSQPLSPSSSSPS